MHKLLKEINRFTAIPINLPMAFTTELEFFKIFMETQNNSESNPEKEKWSCRNQAS